MEVTIEKIEQHRNNIRRKNELGAEFKRLKAQLKSEICKNVDFYGHTVNENVEFNVGIDKKGDIVAELVFKTNRDVTQKRDFKHDHSHRNTYMVGHVGFNLTTGKAIEGYSTTNYNLDYIGFVTAYDISMHDGDGYRTSKKYVGPIKTFLKKCLKQESVALLERTARDYNDAIETLKEEDYSGVGLRISELMRTALRNTSYNVRSKFDADSGKIIIRPGSYQPFVPTKIRNGQISDRQTKQGNQKLGELVTTTTGVKEYVLPLMELGILKIAGIQ